MYELEVAKGSAWLDQVSPGWYKKIDINTLNLSIPNHCSLGQTFGALASRNLCTDLEFALPRGFIISLPKTKTTKKRFFHSDEVVEENASEETYKLRYEQLTAQWIQEILRRRTADRLKDEAVQTVQDNATRKA